MADFYARRDLDGVAFTDAAAKFDFTTVFGSTEAESQVIANESDGAFEISWDGVNVHAYLDGSIVTVIEWSEHERNAVWVRHVPATGTPGAKYIQVIAMGR